MHKQSFLNLETKWPPSYKGLLFTGPCVSFVFIGLRFKLFIADNELVTH